MDEQARAEAMKVALSCDHGRWIGAAQFGACVPCIAAALAQRPRVGRGDKQIADLLAALRRPSFACVAGPGYESGYIHLRRDEADAILNLLSSGGA